MQSGNWRKIAIFALIASMGIMGIFFAFPAHAKDANGLIKDSIDVLKEMKKQEDVSGMADVIKNAHAIAFVPNMIKAGLGIGGEYGEGLILRKEGGKWYGPSFYNVAGGSVGLQIGVQKTAFVLVVNNKEGVDAFLKSRSRLGADATIAAGPVGRRGTAATDARMTASIYSYSMAKGLFAGVSLDGSVLSISVQKNQEFWGREISAERALNTRATDRRILPLIQEIENLSKR